MKYFTFLLTIWLCTNCLGQSLREAASPSRLLIGAAINARYLSEPAYTSTAAREFNMVECENEMKWSATQPSENTFDFTSGDAIVAFAEAHQMKVRGHNLLWHSYNPAWLANGHYTSGQLARLMQQHIEKVVGHYRGRVFAWDVVNEAIDEHGELRHSIWYDQPGIGMAGKRTAYIEQAFRWAHAADPKALLFYNDAAAETVNPHSDAIYAMVKDFRQRGVPIDGVGLQMHILNLNPDVKSIERNIQRFTALGVQVHITEMDIAVPVDAGGNPVNTADLEKQAGLYGEIAGICAANPGCTAIQTWGFTDKYSWIGWFTKHTKGDALLFDRKYQPKPAYSAMRKALQHAAPRNSPAQ